MDYEKLLENAYKQIPEKTLKRERFEMPLIESFKQGNKTIVQNFAVIIKTIGRNPKNAMKFIAKQTGSPTQLDQQKLIIKGKFSAEEIQKLVNDYISRHVLCDECKRPDTKIVEQQGVKILKCEACGAHTPLRE